MSEIDIKDMKLYAQVERIYNELSELGVAGDAHLSPETLFPFDQYHYFGTDTVDDGIALAGINDQHRVLDVGSGLGGPARYLAHTTGCHVTAIEIQADLNKVASDLTERTGLSDKVTHVCSDFLETQATPDYDIIVSWLAFLHIPNRERLLEQCLKALKPGGKLFVEDFHEIGTLTSTEREALAKDVYCEYLPSLEAFAEQCRSAGFAAVTVNDMTPHARPFAIDRVRLFRDNESRNLRVHGAGITNGLTHFYQVVADLFAGGHFGLGRVIATKPTA